jgi:hypothetical protein
VRSYQAVDIKAFSRRRFFIIDSFAAFIGYQVSTYNYKVPRRSGVEGQGRDYVCKVH